MLNGAVTNGQANKRTTRLVALSSIKLFPANELYHAASATHLATIDLANSIRESGILQPLVISRDGFIVSGHRRFVAARLAGLSRVPVRVVRLARSKITAAERPMLDAAMTIISNRAQYWPLSVRTIHYRLLNEPPLRHAGKPKSVYRNDLPSYKSLCDLLTRARCSGLISWDAIDDPTRSVILGEPHANVQLFVRRDLDCLFCRYRCDLQMSQPDHIEILGEKLTIRGTIERVARWYTIPLTLGCGFSSIPLRKTMVDRFIKSGKDRLVVLVVADFDPDGEEIAESFARSMRDDFAIESIIVRKVALRKDQIRRYAKTDNRMEPKRKSSRWPAFAAKYGKNQSVYELEAIAPAALEELLSAAIDSVLDIRAFRFAIEQDLMDINDIEGERQRELRALRVVKASQRNTPTPSSPSCRSAATEARELPAESGGVW